MYKLLTLLYLFFVSSAYSVGTSVKLVFDKKTGTDSRVSYYGYYSYYNPEVYGPKKLRAVYLVPKLGVTFGEFETYGTGVVKPVPGLKLDDGESLTSLFAVSDCKSWYSYLTEVYHVTGGTYFKGYYSVLGSDGSYTPSTYGDYVPLAKELRSLVPKDAYYGLLGVGVPSLVLTHYWKSLY